MLAYHINHQETEWNKDGIVGQELHKVHADVWVNRGCHGYQQPKVGWHINEEPRHELPHCTGEGNPGSGFGLLQAQSLANPKSEGSHRNTGTSR